MLYEEGFKIRIHKVVQMSEQGFKKMNIKRRNVVYKPLLPILLLTSDINNQQKFAEFIYNNFGASEEGVVYRIRYWMKKGKWSRRLKGLCTIELWDNKDGSYGFKFTDGLGNLRRFGFWKD